MLSFVPEYRVGILIIIITHYLFFMKGTVKWFDSAKGYGFITTETGNDIFAHYTGIVKEGFKVLEEGQQVEFEVAEGKKGEQAVNITVVIQ